MERHVVSEANLFDIIILGAGPAGYVAAIRAAQLKKKVCIIEKHEVGGTCLNKGCIPTKSLIASANLFNFLKKASEFGINAENINFNFSAIQERKKRIVDGGINGIKSLFKKNNITLEYGTGVFKEPFLIENHKKNGYTEILKGDKIIISIGSCPANIRGAQIDNEYIFDSDSILNIESLPDSLTIIGGGAVGCEFAYIFNSFGVKVNIVEQLSHLIPLEDEDISATLEREFKKKGIKVHTNKKVEKIFKDNTNLKITLSDNNEIKSDKLLIAIGRRFNTSGFGIENLRINTGEKGNILVNDKMESSVAGIYAAGDAAGKAMLAYVASKEGIVAAENASGIEKKMDYSLIPSTIFTEPEVGCVGLKENDANEKGIKINTGSFQFRSLGRAHASGEISGMVKVISDANTDKVLGVHIIGAHASEIIHEGVVAIKMGMKSKELEDTMHSHPVYSEGLMEGAADIHRRAIHKYRD
ncbi:MAG TPA: dihydrolipoyl dehydrogenase [Nitrospinota bacterium]|nr:dihydrolipoyl dehydrogenase [Nitrospinota bacterium]